MDSNNRSASTAFYTVQEAAQVLRVNPATIYRAIREDAFPSVRIRTRYLVPAAALERLISEAAESGGCIDPAKMIAARRAANEGTRMTGGASW